MPRLDISALESTVQFYFNRGLAPSTQRTYRSAHNRYLKFCSSFNISNPVPLTENGLCAYVSFLAKEGIKYQSVKAYLSALRFLQISVGLPDPYASSSWPRLEYVLKGIRKSVTTGQGTKTRLPITSLVQRQIRSTWQPQAEEPDMVMLWASFCLGFFGFMRAEEFTVPSDGSFDPQVRLTVGDIALDSHSAPSTMRVSLKASKTDPFQHGVHIFIGQRIMPNHGDA